MGKLEGGALGDSGRLSGHTQWAHSVGSMAGRPWLAGFGWALASRRSRRSRSFSRSSIRSRRRSRSMGGRTSRCTSSRSGSN